MSDAFAEPVSVSALVPQAHDEGAILEDGGTLQRMTDGRYATAITVQRPRDLAQVEKDVLIEAELLGESAYYGWGAGRDKIEGPSTYLADMLQRNWGNCAVTMEPVQDLPDCWIFSSAFIDLEKGSTKMRQFRQSKKWMVYGKFDAERKNDIRFQIGQSKCDRNVILKALPKWLVDRALECAKAGVRKRIEVYISKNGLEAARSITMTALAKHAVSEERVLTKFVREAVAGLTVDNLVTIKGDLRALDEGAESAESLYPSKGDIGKPTASASAGATSRERLEAKAEAAKKPPPPHDNVAFMPGLEPEKIARAEADMNAGNSTRLHPPEATPLDEYVPPPDAGPPEDPTLRLARNAIKSQMGQLSDKHVARSFGQANMAGDEVAGAGITKLMELSGYLRTCIETNAKQKAKAAAKKTADDDGLFENGKSSSTEPSK